MNYEKMTKKELLNEVVDLGRAYDWANEERIALIRELEAVADDPDKLNEYSYAPGVARWILVKLGHRKR